jgi:Fur family transcriptional regulator, ferric uptake regulator
MSPRRPSRPAARTRPAPAEHSPAALHGQHRTRQRAAIAALLDRSPGFRSAQHLHAMLRGQGEQIGLATVYRTLHALTAAGHCDTIRNAHGETLYRQCASTGHHHHLTCRVCGDTIEITSPALKRQLARLAAQHGYRDTSHIVEITGTCPACARRQAGAS